MVEDEKTTEEKEAKETTPEPAPAAGADEAPPAPPAPPALPATPAPPAPPAEEAPAEAPVEEGKKKDAAEEKAADEKGEGEKKGDEGEDRAPSRRSRTERPSGRGRRRRQEEPPPELPPLEEPVKYQFDFKFPPLFGKWDWYEVVVSDVSLRNYINLDPLIVPHVGGKYANKPFGNTKVNIVERLINNMMRTEHTTGNKAKAYRVVQDAFEIINKKTKKNPIQVFVDALESAAPKEEITRLKYGGISVPKAVDIAASRRLDVALRNICKGAHQSSRKNKKKLEACLAEEILRAANSDLQSFAIAKKDEIERIAASAR